MRPEDIINFGSGALGAAAIGSAYNRLGRIGDEALSGANTIAQQGLQQGQFQPYTVTSGLGNISAGPDGTQLNLSPEQQAQQQQLGQGAKDAFGRATDPSQYNQYQNQISQIMGGLGATNPQAYQGIAGVKNNAFGLSGQMMNAAGQDTAGRESDIFANIRAMQQPDEQRQRLMLEERLQNQGRLGLRTGMFGGTPEQFSMDQAQAESRNQAALMAMQQAQAQQAQQAGIASQMGQLGYGGAGLQQNLASQATGDFANLAGLGSGLQGQQAALGQQMLQGQYMPQASLLQGGQLGFNNAGLAQNAQQFGAGLFGEASMGGLEARLGAGLGQANLMGNVGSGLLTGALGSAGNWFTKFATGG